MRLGSALNRYRLLWRFVKLLPRAQEIEKEVQGVTQKYFDARFENDLRNKKEEVKVAYLAGFLDGVNWCLKKL